MQKSLGAALAGFAVLFALYHAAEYMILFQNSPLGFLAFQLLFFVAAWAIAKWQAKTGLGAWGLDGRKRLLAHLGAGIIMGILLYGLTFLAGLWLDAERLVSIPAFGTILSPLLLFVVGNFFSSFSEDVLTRGYVWHHLKGKVAVRWLVAISALVYLCNHIYRLDDGPITWLYLFALGILYVIPLVLTQRLWFTGGMHWAGNVTFYLTHELWQTEDGSRAAWANLLLVVVALVMLPVTVGLLQRMGWVNQKVKEEHRVTEVA